MLNQERQVVRAKSVYTVGQQCWAAPVYQAHWAEPAAFPGWTELTPQNSF